MINPIWIQTQKLPAVFLLLFIWYERLSVRHSSNVWDFRHFHSFVFISNFCLSSFQSINPGVVSMPRNYLLANDFFLSCISLTLVSMLERVIDCCYYVFFVVVVFISAAVQRYRRWWSCSLWWWRFCRLNITRIFLFTIQSTFI